ncbi:MAG: hypothetical protein IR158_15005 [Cellulomonas sp.]|uniref:hypothetical protein n=1 Tax=Cellulomonas sp. TaxID=40001 RepID=UPI0019DA313F|nr:hypothetical protein [Cellulomonas sp.]MBF0689061.1 hypothetical protein [Cellulomonas sp.]
MSPRKPDASVSVREHDGPPSVREHDGSLAVRGYEAAAAAWFARPAPDVDLSPPPADEAEADARSFAAAATTLLHDHQQALDGKGVPTSARVTESLFTHRFVPDVASVVGDTTSILLPTTCRLVAPPYDQSWTLGPGSQAQHKFGDLMCSGTDGSSAAALGLYLSSDSATDVSLTPEGRFTFVCMPLSPDMTHYAGRGGLAITIYRAGSDRPAYSRQVTLWDVRGSSLPKNPDPRAGSVPHGASGGGSLADASSPPVAGSFGSFPLAPVGLALRPGVKSLVWVWAWQVCARSSLALSMISVKMPAVRVCTVPPLVLH